MPLGWILTAGAAIIAAALLLFAVADYQVSQQHVGVASTDGPTASSARGAPPSPPRLPATLDSDHDDDAASEPDDFPPAMPNDMPEELPPYEPPPTPAAPAKVQDKPADNARRPRAEPVLPPSANPDPVPLPSKQEKPTPTPAIDRAVIDRLNSHRKLAGLGPVRLDASISQGCVAHAHYLARNSGQSGGLNVHSERADLAGYTPGGAVSAMRSVIMQSMGFSRTLWQVDAVDGWIATLYHRLPLLHPDLERVGLGYATSGDGRYRVAVLDARSGLPRRWSLREGGFRTVIYPADQQKDVPCMFSFGAPESPNPLPNNGDSRSAGYPITVEFIGARSINAVEASLTTADGNDCPVWLSTPKRPANSTFPQQGTVCLIPKSPLRAGITHTVSCSALIDGTAWKQSWQFTTIARRTAARF
jgi:uncharacterized protein YkwD